MKFNLLGKEIKISNGRKNYMEILVAFGRNKLLGLCENYNSRREEEDISEVAEISLKETARLSVCNNCTKTD